MNILNDEELISVLKSNGKYHAFKHIVSSFKENLYWHILKILINHEDSDDVLQNTFINAWEGLDNLSSKF